MEQKDVKEIKDRLDLVNTNLAAILGLFRTYEEEEVDEPEEDTEEDEDE